MAFKRLREGSTHKDLREILDDSEQKEPDEDRGCGWRANKSSPKGLTSRHCFPICISSFNPHNGPKREELLITLTFWVRRLRSRDSRYLV